MKTKSSSKNFFLRIHPVWRVLISVVLGAITLFFIPAHTSSLIEIMSVWLAFAISYLITGWIILFTRPIDEIRRFAKLDDGSKFFVSMMVLLSSLTSIVIVMLLMISKAADETEHGMFVFVSIAGILLSWFMVHTLYTFHYAHMYYDDNPKDNTKDAQGLNFPQDEEPDYIDFAYFAFVIGCTFQVSDVEISSREIRRSVLVHQLISFFLNTCVVALTINLIAGLMK